MVSNSTVELVNLVADVNIEYNIKLFIMISMWIYFAFVFWFSFKFNGDRLFVKIWRIISRLVSIPYLVFAPLFIFFLLRTVEFEILYNYMLWFYGIFLFLWFVLFLLAIYEYATYIIGIDITPSRIVKEFGSKTPFSEDFIERE